MKFSIITCTKNSERYIRENILSVETQTFTDYEHIFIDGHSTDKTKEIINEYKKRHPDRVRLYEYEPRGIANAMNMGIKHATGEYLNFLNSDDQLYDNNVLLDVDSYLRKRPADWIYGKEVRMINEKVFSRSNQNWYLRLNNHSFIGRFLLKNHMYIKHQATFFNHTVFTKYGIYNESLRCAMDYELYLRINGRTEWYYIDRIIDTFRIHVDSQSYSVLAGENNAIETLSIQYKYMNRLEKRLFVFFYIAMNSFGAYKFIRRMNDQIRNR